MKSAMKRAVAWRIQLVVLQPGQVVTAYASFSKLGVHLWGCGESADVRAIPLKRRELSAQEWRLIRAIGKALSKLSAVSSARRAASAASRKNTRAR